MVDEQILDYNIYLFPELEEEVQAQVLERVRSSKERYNSLSDLDIQDIIELEEWAFLADGSLIEN